MSSGRSDAPGISTRTGAGAGGGTLVRLWDVIVVLVTRDYKGRYKNTVIGLGWSLISPLMYLAVFYTVFRIAFAISVPFYATYVFIGVLAWMWVQSALNDSVGSITSRPNLIMQPGFPVAALPIAAIATNLITFAAATPVLILIALIEGAGLHVSILLMPLIAAVQFLLMLGFAYIVAALNVVFRDTQYILPVVLQLGYYISPIFYDPASIPAEYRSLLQLNPLYHIIAGYRAVVIDGVAPQFLPLAIVAAASIVLLVIAHRYFMRASANFLEEI
ncbi:ABC transporter permease [Croceibacterium sp. TMG7-5b_MA50]|uniref:ABC transporter permease n=1 Tax=Croceibacterium sp. TMG7-5b_MA50 TaxID=3121290 RepID=UPI0032219C5E